MAQSGLPQSGNDVETFQFLGLTAVVASDRMRQTLDLTARVARSNATVLIQGESGSGKEVVARALHQMSLRCAKPWVDVSCGALPEHLIESELFGYEKGAFSGADSPKPGLFELAHSGTLFLDEVGELEPKMQVKLLRVLDGTPYYRLGGTRKISVDVRILAATNQDLEEFVRQGRFRADLFHRLSQVQLRVPPLRERLEDIEPIAQYFLRMMNPELRIGAAALAAMQTHHWPGNIRELRNLITRASIMSQGPSIQPHELGLPATQASNGHSHLGISAAGPGANGLASLAAALPPPGDLDGIERQTILRVLDQTGGHRQKAADILGISRRTLTRKLKLYGFNESAVDPPELAPACEAIQGSL